MRNFNIVLINADMDIIKRIESKIKYDYRFDSKEQIKNQIDSLHEFDNLTTNEIQYLLSNGHKSSEVGLVLEYFGYEKLEKYLNRILSFLMDMNWPAAHLATNIILESGEKILPEIKKVFLNENDDIWNYWILSSIISRWQIELVNEIKPELIYLVEKELYYLQNKQDYMSYRQINAVSCLLILDKHKLISKERLNEYYLKLEKYFLVCDSESDKEDLEKLRIACN